MEGAAESQQKSPGRRQASAAEQAEQRLTPMLRQYMDAKAECPGAILLFRMGDFFELFFDDAKVAAEELELTLTSRDKDRGEPIPMAGVPHHAVEGYIARLVRKGYTVAVCDQIEDPKQAKGLVRRAITRLVTPGTTTDLEALDPGAASYLGSVQLGADGLVSLALCDLLAGELLITEVPLESLGDELARMGVRELLCEAAAEQQVKSALVGRDLSLRGVSAATPAAEEARRRLAARLPSIPEGASAASHLALLRLVDYAEATQRRSLSHLLAPRAYRVSDFLVLDEATRRNLELVHTQLGAERRGSLLWHLDRCKTAMGTRRLTHWLLFPLRERAAIEARLDVVQAFKGERHLRQELQQALVQVRDLERLAGRVAVGRATPRELASLRQTLQQVPRLRGLLVAHPSALGERWRQVDDACELRQLLERALVDEPPVQVSEGGVFRRGYEAELDELIGLSQDGHGFLAELEQRERARTGIGNLKVRFNKVFGYYLEVTRANLDAVPADYVRKQTLVGAERFITDELKRFEERVLSADEKRRAREQELYAELVAKVALATGSLRELARLLAETDVLLALAQVADEGRYARPQLCDEPLLSLVESRHPVVERLLPGGERFVPNDVELSANERQLVVVTGPNMAGKSTVMRQVALCTLLAHMGAFVPAKRATIGLCDRIFTRVGAADNLGRGHSTFMVEMLETAAILRHASRHSLVLLDEIGRGTSTFDGVSIAWSVAEHLHDTVGCRAMFATHYHELVDLALERPRIKNVSVAVKEHNGGVVFLRRLVEGAANRSYGIQVARLAGLPEPVLTRARQILANLEQGELDEEGMPALARTCGRQGKAQLALFTKAAPARPAQPPLPALPQATPVLQELTNLDPLRMTPIEAMVALERLHRLALAAGSSTKE